MVNNIPGINTRIQPNVISRVRTRQRVNAAAGGLRTVAIIGEGETEETVISPALGGGADGVNPDYSGNNTPDGRHFQLSKTALTPKRTSVLKNGIPLVVLEGTIDSDSFDSRYDVRVEPTTGRIQLQDARLVDVGSDGSTTQYYTPRSSNIGDGAPQLTQASLVDTNAPAETWTLRVVSIVVDGSGDPVPGEATLTLTGSTSGQINDANGNPITWGSDGYVVSNGILSFAVTEGTSAFRVGDRFTIEVDSGVLEAGDELVARYIATEDLNDPEVFSTPADLFAKHGEPSLDNNLSLGAQIAFENGAPQVVALQAKPSIPRRTSEFLLTADNPLTTETEGATGGTDIEDSIFPLQLGAVPDVDTQVKLFVVDSDGSEEELLVNKFDFYDPSFTTQASAYTGFVTSGAFVSSYTVFSASEVEQEGDDGYVLALSGTEIEFSAPSATFRADRNATGESDVGKTLTFLSPDGLAGASSVSTYTIDTIGDGYGNLTTVTATLDSGPDPSAGDGYFQNVDWQLQDSNDTGSYLALTDDVVTTYLTAGKGLRVQYIDTDDADFFDTNWAEAYEALELADVQFVAPLPKATISNIFSAGKIHVETMSNAINAKERVLLIGAQTGLAPNNLDGTELAAVENIGVLEGIQGDDPEEVLAGNIEDLANYSVPAAYGDSFRVVFMSPDQIVRNINGSNTFLPGYYMSTALGGFLSGQTAIQEPPTFKTLAGFNILRDRVYRPTVLNSLADAGVLVVQPVAGGGRMLHGLTTVQSLAPEEEEISIVGIRDQIARVLRASLRPFVGRVNSPTVISDLTAGVDKILRSQISAGLLSGVGAISVQRNPVEPRQIDISAEINPASPINWIFIDVTVSI